jgi:hypothetical protein
MKVNKPFKLACVGPANVTVKDILTRFLEDSSNGDMHGNRCYR